MPGVVRSLAVAVGDKVSPSTAVLWIRTHFFGFGSTNLFYSASVLDSDPYTNILTRNFLKWYHREKSFPIEKLTFFLFKVFDLQIFTKFFILQQRLDPNPNPNPNFFFGCGFGSSQNIRILSDSDPQHCSTVRNPGSISVLITPDVDTNKHPEPCLRSISYRMVFVPNIIFCQVPVWIYYYYRYIILAMKVVLCKV
jgi:hypothetical protein